MIEFQAKLRRWGRSFGIVVPMEKIREASLGENENIKVLVTKKRNPFKETFGMIKLKRKTQEILDESDREAWDE